MRNLFGEEVGKKKAALRPRAPGSKKPSTKKTQGLGCDHCPMNSVDGINKVIGIDRIKGRRAMLWAQSPGKNENGQKLELVGAVGKFIWEELKPFGLTRNDFDIQNVMRCRPWDDDLCSEYQPKDKVFKQVLNCCSVYNPQAVEANKGKAVVHLILGKVAGQKLLGKAYRKDQAVIWYEPWNAYVVVADHPSYLLRIGGRKAGWPYYTFRDRLKTVKSILEHPGRWGYLEHQDYGAVTTPEEMKELKEFLVYKAIDCKENISVDVEDGLDEDGNRIPLLIGFGWGKYDGPQGPRSLINSSWDGGARAVVLNHPEADQSPKRLKPILKLCQEIIEDVRIKKTFQHGSYDDGDVFKDMFGWTLRGYNFDTQYACYLKHPHLRSFSLDRMVQFFLPEFGDYKMMMVPYSGNFAKAPLDLLISYNCADCDATKRMEAKTSPSINHSLLQIYIHCAYVLEQMEPRGPFLDYDAVEKLRPVVHEQVESLRRQLEQCAGGKKEGFNPNTPAHIAWLLFDHLGLPRIEGNSTSKTVMEALLIQTDSKVPQLVIDYRSLSKLEGTYIVGYTKSADKHHGRLATIWHLTGAVTGRLRSGKSDKAEKEEGIVNLQNIDGRPILQNLLVSDPNWRKAL